MQGIDDPKEANTVWPATGEGIRLPSGRIQLVTLSMRVRMMNAAVEGFLWFIRRGVPLTLLLLTWGWLAQDYYKVRIQASRGNAVFEMVQAQQRNQQQGQGK